MRTALHTVFGSTKRTAPYIVHPSTELGVKQLSTYQNIHKLPLTVFIDVLVTKNLQLLIIDGNATNEDLTPIWETLYAEYMDSIAGAEMRGRLESVKDSAIIQSRINRARITLELIEKISDKRLIELLYDYDYPLPPLTADNVELVINTFLAYYKSDFIDLQILAKQDESEGDEITIDYNYFMSTIVDMNIGMKTNININELSVGAYCAYVNKYREYCKSKQRKVE